LVKGQVNRSRYVSARGSCAHRQRCQLFQWPCTRLVRDTTYLGAWAAPGLRRPVQRQV